MSSEEYKILIAQMTASIYAGFIAGRRGAENANGIVQTAKELAQLCGIEEPK